MGLRKELFFWKASAYLEPIRTAINRGELVDHILSYMLRNSLKVWINEEGK